MDAVSAVVFDWYNTLAAPHPDDFWTRLPELIGEAGGTPDEGALRHWEAGHPIEHPEHSSSEGTYRAWQRGRFEDLLARCEVPEPQRSVLLDEVEHARYTRLFDVFDDVIDVLGGLRSQGYTVGICSNWDWDLHRHLRHNALVDLVDFVVCSAIRGLRKPHPAIFETVRSSAGVPASRIVFVGDSWHDDITGATGAGLRAVHIDRQGACDEHPLAEVPCLRDLRAITAVLR